METAFVDAIGASMTFIIIALVILILPSFRVIGPTEVGLVTKRLGFKKLKNDNPIAFQGEAGYQADLLMPGLRFKLWIIYSIKKYPWVQVPAGQIGVVIAQVGSPLPIGAKSAVYKPDFGNFSDMRRFVAMGGQKGVQRPVLSPGTLAPIHPVAFLIITRDKVYGTPISDEYRSLRGMLSPATFGLSEEQLNVTRIEPITVRDGGKNEKLVDTIGIVTALEGDPLPKGDIASRLGGFDDIKELEKAGKEDEEIVEALTGSKNGLHNNYQDFQAFLDHGGFIGLQHDPLLYGAYNLNPFLIRVEKVPMLVIEQGEVAVVKSYVGLTQVDTTGEQFKFGYLTRPGHRGIWQEPLRTGKYPINPHCYQPVIVPTAILTLNWADAVSEAHLLDQALEPIVAKSREGFVFKIDLQVQIHIADSRAPRVISIVGSVQNLVNEVLQAAVGNHFRDKLQSMPAVMFIETRQAVQEEAFKYIRAKLEEYEVETKGVYIQDVILPEAMVKVLTEREIARQEIETFKKQKEAQDQRITMEHAKGTADMQNELAKSKVGIDIKSNNASARKAEAEGEAAYIRDTGSAKGAEVEAVGMAKAKAYEAQVKALGEGPTTIVNVVTAMAERGAKFMPDNLVIGGGSPAIDGLASVLMKYLGGKSPEGDASKKLK